MILKGKHIFVIDDDVTNLAIITAILKRNGATVYSDVWGLNPIIQLKYLDKVDVILLDLMLQRAGINGYDVFDKIKNDPEVKDIPVILVTAADPYIEAEKARSKGFKGLISKPLDRNTFGQKIASVIEGETTWDF